MERENQENRSSIIEEMLKEPANSKRYEGISEINPNALREINALLSEYTDSKTDREIDNVGDIVAVLGNPES